MFDGITTKNERDAIQAEQVKAYFKDAGVLNIAGTLVFTLLVLVVHEETPLWTWAPALILLYLVTFVRGREIRQYRRSPESRTSRQWINGQTRCGGLAGICWGVANTAMLAHLPVSLQLFVLTVASVVAAAATFESFLLVLPPRAFNIASISPIAAWLWTVGDSLHYMLALMLLLFLPVTILLGNRKSRIFIEAQRLRLRNESLVTELSRQHELLEAASKAKSRFLAAASHDLRQPLAALMIFLDLLESERLSVKGKDILDHAQQSTASLRNLLDALLDISKFDAGVIKPDFRTILIRDLFDELGNEFMPLAERKGISLRFVPSGAAVRSDPNLLSQILRNLIANAIRYTKSGRVLVGCRHRAGMLAIEVHDTGIGIPENQLPKIFDEFYQVGNAERDRQQGLGLGLSIVDRAARLLGHSVTVRSRLGKGSSFGLIVPLATNGFEEQRPMGRNGEAGDFTGQLVAFIENEGAIRAGMQSLLQAWGWKVLVADSVASMLEQIDRQDEEVDMLISDFGLRGDQNGIDAIAAIWQRIGSRTPALLFTGDISRETYAAAKEAGIPILHKPAKPEALRAAISAAMETSRHREVEQS